MTVTRTLLRERLAQAGLYREALIRALSQRESNRLRHELAEAEAAIADARASLADLDASGAPPLVVVVPCSTGKRPHRTTAGEMYTGSYHRACRRYAERIGADRILVLSALHGLLDLDEPIDPYDLRMGRPGSVTTATIRDQAERLGLAGAHVVLLGGRAYVDRAAPVWPQARIPLAHAGGIGSQLAVLAHGPDTLLEQADAYRAAWTGASTESAQDAGDRDADGRTTSTPSSSTPSRRSPGARRRTGKPVARSARTLRLPALEIRQGSRTIYGFAVDGKLLSSFAAVSRIRRARGRIDGYQRPEVLAHVAAIRKYLESDEAMLPNALVVALDRRVAFEPLAADDTSDLARLGTMVIPLDPTWTDEDKPGWAVDGQQRWAAIRDADVAAFPVLVGAFITDAHEEQRQQFILLNNTKPLPKGLIHELLPATTGTLPANLSRRRFPAYLLDRLNHDEDSPMRGRIRTPTAPDGVIRDNSVLRMIENSLSDGALYEHRDPVTGAGDAEAMLAVLKPFWAAVAAVFPEAWELPPRRSRLTHGVGVVALGYVMDSLMAWHSAASADDFVRWIEPLRGVCRWTSGTWDFGRLRQRPWNDLQNIAKDTRLLTNHLLAHLESPNPKGRADA